MPHSNPDPHAPHATGPLRTGALLGPEGAGRAVVTDGAADGTEGTAWGTGEAGLTGEGGPLGEGGVTPVA